MMWIDNLLEKNIVPDSFIRVGIQQLLRQRQKESQRATISDPQYLQNYIDSLKASPIAVETDKANEQHYEVPTEFYLRVLGKHLKYSCALWENELATIPASQWADKLHEAETAMLQLTCERADLSDGQTVLELGCGWGSLSLWMAAHYPNSLIVSVSNSATQKEYIDGQALERGLGNLKVVTADMNDFQTVARFDRIVSVEMFEHMRNYEQLMHKVSNLLVDGGKLFVHIFTHLNTPYFFEDNDGTDWMARYFFSGGQMPSRELLLHFADEVSIERLWHVNGVHYQKTCEAWLQRMDREKDEINDIFKTAYGEHQITKWTVYWRVFFMACAELFGFRGGEEWFVTHYRFVKRGVQAD